MTKFTAALLLAGLALAMPSTASGFELLKEIRHHSSAELSTLHAAANKGDAKAQLEYGKALVYLHRDAKNGVTEADYQKWFRKASDQGLGEAWYWLGYTTSNQNLLRTAYDHAAELGFAPAFDDVLEQLLFRAGEQADVIRAKHFADLARQKGITFYNAAESFATVDACYAAGTATLSAAERAAIAKNGRTEDSFTPNDNMRFAEAFANGWGVKRDSNRAIAFVCHASDVPAELNGMVADLLKRDTVAVDQNPFLFCDKITSGEHGGECAAFEGDKHSAERERIITKLQSAYTPAQKLALTALRKAAGAYFNSHAGEEQDMSGTLRGALFADEMNAMEQRFIDDLAGFEHGKLLAKDDFSAADKSLNAAYHDIIKNYDRSTGGTVTPDSLRATERLWIAYRDAWVAFGTLRYPATHADDWKAWVTRVRITNLKESFSSDR